MPEQETQLIDARVTIENLFSAHTGFDSYYTYLLAPNPMPFDAFERKMFLPHEVMPHNIDTSIETLLRDAWGTKKQEF